MSLPEVAWRLQQKRLQAKEGKAYGHRKVSVAASLFDRRLNLLRFNPDALGINFDNKAFGTNTTIRLLGGYSYNEYKKRWNAGFQTENVWGDEFSLSLDYKQRDDIGDARTNWELNRHFQFALLAKAFYVTGDRKYFDELKKMFYDWNRKNPFLHGISWTSVMEVAIRCIQWSVAMAFLSSCKDCANDKLLVDFGVGIKNMASYISRHYSRFSSANNHLLVEATALAYAGFAFGLDEWKLLAIRILDDEVLKQNYADGVNKEMSLHYQTFGMEAYALVMHLMQRNGMPAPKRWSGMMAQQCEFVAHSMVGETKACEFGDNDEGKVLDLEGGGTCHYRYVLQLCSLVLGKRYEALNHISETIGWLFTDAETNHCRQKALYDASRSRTFPYGGYTFLRSKDSRVVIGIDHAPLGFGSIAAHGHADALSFQLYVDGHCILGDPGTYIYHCRLGKRNEYRKTCNHNTLCIDGKDQSEMLGAFLWGRKARTRLIKSDLGEQKDDVAAECDGYKPILHKREFLFDKYAGVLKVTDSLSQPHSFSLDFVVAPGNDVEVRGGSVVIVHDSLQATLTFDCPTDIRIVPCDYSEHYGVCAATSKVQISCNGNSIVSQIVIKDA